MIPFFFAIRYLGIAECSVSLTGIIPNFPLCHYYRFPTHPLVIPKYEVFHIAFGMDMFMVHSGLALEMKNGLVLFTTVWCFCVFSNQCYSGYSYDRLCQALNSDEI